MLVVENLHVSVEDKEILKGVSLTVKPDEIHVLMGPNGSGKSTLAQTVMGRPGYQITRGAIRFDGEDITGLSPDERARRGIFLAFQYPVEVPGVGLAHFLKSVGGEGIGVRDFRQGLKEKLRLLQMGEDFLDRNLNEDFSGGEKKKAEILQLAVLEPKIAILDETDSGLDVDSLKTVAAVVENLSEGRGFLVITHYQRILRHIKPDYVHVMVGGKIVKSGGPELAREVEEKGYESIRF